MKKRNLKYFFRIFFITILLCGCETIVTVTPFGESIPSPIPTPNTYDNAVQFLTGSAEERILGMWAIRTNYPDQFSKVIPLIIENLYYEYNSEVKIAAADVLGEFGPEANQAVPDLIRILQEDNTIQVRRSIVLTLGEIGNPSVVPILAANLYDSDDVTQTFSASSIALITGEKFTDWDSKGGYVGNEEGVSLIVLDARIWWEEEGKNIDWLNFK